MNHEAYSLTFGDRAALPPISAGRAGWRSGHNGSAKKKQHGVLFCRAVNENSRKWKQAALVEHFGVIFGRARSRGNRTFGKLL